MSYNKQATINISKETILEIIENHCTNIQIPYFQRNYVWEKREVINLLNDIEKYANYPNEYFLGPIIFTNKGMQRILIDGQQRISTICIILAVLCEVIVDDERIAEIKKILNKFKFESYNILDKDGLKDIIHFKFNNKESRYYQNYQIIKDWFKTYPYKKQIILNNIYQLFCSFCVFDNNINENILFSKINSTGKKLTAFDMIKNHLLSWHSTQLADDNYLATSIDEELFNKNEIFNQIWKDLNAFETNVDNMIRYFICSHTHKLSKNDPYILFDEYMKLTETNNQTALMMMNDLITFSSYYIFIKNKKYWSNNKKENDKVAKPMLILDTEINTFLPLLIKVFTNFTTFDYPNITYTDLDQLYEALSLIEYFIIGFKFNSQKGKILSRYIPKVVHDLNHLLLTNPQASFLECLYYVLTITNADDKKAYELPDTQQTKHNFVHTDAYTGLSKFTKAFLTRIATLKNPLVCSEFDHQTIEHIMPQNLSLWKANGFEISDEDFNHYLHTIGNLTLTNHNAAYSNYCFQDKKAKMFTVENNNLNFYLVQKEDWNVEEIKQRSIQLFALFKTHWNFEYLANAKNKLTVANTLMSKRFLDKEYCYEGIKKNLIHFKRLNLLNYDALEIFKSISQHYLVNGDGVVNIERKLFNDSFKGWIPWTLFQFINITKAHKLSMNQQQFDKWWAINEAEVIDFIDCLIEFNNYE